MKKRGDLMEETGRNMQNYISRSRKCINESRACNLAEYGFMFSIDTRLSARNVMKTYNMYYTEGDREYSTLNL